MDTRVEREEAGYVSNTHPPTRVSELIISTTSSWNEQLVRATFIPLDAEAILKILLCTRQNEDFWAWSEERKGNFTVRHAFRMIQRTKFSREAWLLGQGDHHMRKRIAKGG